MSTISIGSDESEMTMTPANTAVAKDRPSGLVGRLKLALALATVFLWVGVGSASAAPRWEITTSSNTTVAPGGQLTYHLAVENAGVDATDGSQIDLTVTPPAGVTVSSVSDLAGLFDCSALVPGSSDPFTCTTSNVVDFQQGTTLTIATDVPLLAPLGTMTAMYEISGGGAASAISVDATRVSSTPPAFGIDFFDGQVVANEAGDPFTQAGGRPYAIQTQILLNAFTHPVEGDVWPVEPFKDVIVDLPPGLVGDPTSLRQCTAEQLADPSGVPACPSDSQVGVVRIRFNGAPGVGKVAVFNVDPPAGVPARFAFSAAGTLINLDASLRSDSDYGVSVSAKKSPEGFALVGSEVTFWSDPSDPAHDPQRFCPGTDVLGTGCTLPPSTPFLRNPTACTGPGVGLETRLRTDSWVHPGDYETASFVSHLPPGFPFPPEDWGAQQGPTGCDLVPFDVSLAAAPAMPARANSPSAFSFDVSLPQSATAEIGQSDLKKVVVTLPKGVRVSPPSAAGLQGCTEAQIGLSSLANVSCPDGSKLGTLTVDTPLLDEQLKGAVYLATPFENPSGTLLGIYLVAKGSGLIVKLPGRVDPDPGTGQLTATFDDNPQLPFSNLHLELFSGERAALVLPQECGTYTTRAELTGWNGRTRISESSFTVDRAPDGGPCAPRGFDPDFAAGTVNPIAGAFSPFVARIQRGDSDKELDRIDLSVPRGLVADLSAVQLCTNAQATAAAARPGVAAQTSAGCPAGSQIGTVTVGAGSGSSPFYPRLPGTDVTGRVFLAEAYTQSPHRLPGVGDPAYGLVIEVPAVAGPFDLGNIVVRAAIFVDPETAKLSVLSDPMPRILQGIPLQVRDVHIHVDRPRFTVNPTRCEQTNVMGDIRAHDGTTVSRASRFQVGECSRLKLSPRLKMRLTGRKQIRTGGHPALGTRLTQPSGQANIASARVRLPKSLALDPDNARALCEFEDGTKPDIENHCPKGSIVGRARAISPLLNDPLVGNVYFVKNVRTDTKTGNRIRTLPMIVVALRGEIAINLVGKTSTTKAGELVSTFASVPDAPVSKFNLNIKGGRNGILAVTRTRKARINLCSKPESHVVEVDIGGHNGKRRDFNVVMKTPCTKRQIKAAKRQAQRAAAKSKRS